MPRSKRRKLLSMGARNKRSRRRPLRLVGEWRRELFHLQS